MLTMDQIVSTATDENLRTLLFEETIRLVPNEIIIDPDSRYKIIKTIPPGIRACDGLYDLDVSMMMDDLAWHFYNHNEERHIQETIWSLNEFNATDVADLFEKAVDIVQPHLETLRAGVVTVDRMHKWLESTGIQAACNPLDAQLWKILHATKLNSFYQFAVNHAPNKPAQFLSM